MAQQDDESIVLAELGEKLRKLRVVRGFSQEYVAGEVKISLSTYQRYEAGKVGVDFITMVKICELYGLTVDQFLKPVASTSRATLAGWSGSTEVRHLPQLRHIDTQVVVTLDGTRETLRKWIKKLSAINTVLQ